MPDFHHSFSPAGGSALGNVASLTIREIEDAGLREMLQTPGVSLGNWGILNALLDTRSPYFVFREALGQSREVKTAVSGLFGRFVARAYAKRYLGYSYFTHIQRVPMRLAGRGVRGVVQRVPQQRGDLPDWVSRRRGGNLAIIEAKGSHDPKGPTAALARAFLQAGRAEIAIGQRLAPLKRYAIATRWGFASPSSMAPFLAVEDPEVEGDHLSPEEVRALEVGVVRRHYASLLRGLGHTELAAAILRLVASRSPDQEDAAINAARTSLVHSKGSTVRLSDASGPKDALIGSVVVQDRLRIVPDVSPEDQRTLGRLRLRPAFVGVERRALEAAIEGSIDNIDAETAAATTGEDDDKVGSDASEWVVRLDEDSAEVT